MIYEQQFLFSLLLTLIIEIPAACLVIKYLYKKTEIKISKIIFVGFAANALTLPYFWFITPAFIPDRNTYIVTGELLVIIVEAIIYNQLLKLKLPEALAVSLVANGSSMLLGLLF